MIEAAPPLGINLTLILLTAFTVGMLLEMFCPARSNRLAVGRWVNNGALAFVSYSSNHLFGTLLAAGVLLSLDSGHQGLTALPLWAATAVVLIAMELMRYSIHVAMHKVPLLWRLHAVHHSDSECDISTSFRHHPLELALSALPLALLLWLLSAPVAALLIYRAFDLVVTVLSHANTRLPGGLERWLGYLVVTPSFHRTHHMAERRFTDSNYSTVVPWLDYLFKTYQPTSDAQQLAAPIGLDTQTPHEQRIDGMLIAPFVTRRAAD